MKQYVRNKIIFEGDPIRISSLANELKNGSENGVISLNAVIPLADGQDPLDIWGTKNEAEEVDSVVYHSGSAIEYSFDTLKDPPVHVFKKLAETYSYLKMTVNYALEDYGESCGIYTSESDSTELVFSEPDDPFEFACLIWDVDPEEEMQERYINYMEE